MLAVCLPRSLRVHWTDICRCTCCCRTSSSWRTAAGGDFAMLQSAGVGDYGLIIVNIIAAGEALLGTCPAMAMNFLEAIKGEKCKCGDAWTK